MTPDQTKALNQLVSVLAGGRTAKATNDLSETPLKRIEECLGVALWELNQAVMQGEIQAQKQSQRKIESLQSLRTLSESL